MRQRRTILILLLTTFAVITITFFDLSQGNHTFRGFQASQASSKSPKSSPTVVQTEYTATVEKSNNDQNNEEISNRRLQDTSASENQDSNTTSEIENETDNSSDRSSTTASTSTVSHLYYITPSQAYASKLVSGALNHGMQFVLDIGINQKNIPPLPNDYNITKFVGTAYRRYSGHAVYYFRIKMANSQYNRVNANFTVMLNYTTDEYSVMYYAYHSFNYTLADLYPNITVVNSTSNLPQAQSTKIPLTLDEVNTNGQILSALLHGVNGVLGLARSQGQINHTTDDSDTFNVSYLFNASYREQINGVRYWFSTELTNFAGNISVDANFSVFYNNDTVTDKLMEYSYLVKHLLDVNYTGIADDTDGSDSDFENSDYTYQYEESSEIITVSELDETYEEQDLASDSFLNSDATDANNTASATIASDNNASNTITSDNGETIAVNMTATDSEANVNNSSDITASENATDALN